jgi:hypothetical protein
MNIFISYSSEDGPIADSLAGLLQAKTGQMPATFDIIPEA